MLIIVIMNIITLVRRGGFDALLAAAGTGASSGAVVAEVSSADADLLSMF